MQISPIQQNSTSFGDSVDLINKIITLNPKHTAKRSKQNSVTTFGSSASSNSINKYCKANSDNTSHCVKNSYDTFISKRHIYALNTKTTFLKSSNIISFCGKKSIDKLMHNLYESFCADFSAKHGKKSLINFIRQTLLTTPTIGQGTEKKIYAFPKLNDYVIAHLYHKEPLKKEVAIQKIQLKYPKYNFSEPFAGNHYDIFIMKKVEGVSNSVNNYGPAAINMCKNGVANREFAQEYLTKLKLFENFPQAAYDDLLNQIEYLTNKGVLIDSGNPNNLMINVKTKRFHLIDLPSKRQQSVLKKAIESSKFKTYTPGLYDTISLLLDSKFQCYYMDFMTVKEKEETISISKKVIKNLKTAIKKTKLQEKENLVRVLTKYIGDHEPIFNENLYKRYDESLDLYKDILN